MGGRAGAGRWTASRGLVPPTKGTLTKGPEGEKVRLNLTPFLLFHLTPLTLFTL